MNFRNKYLLSTIRILFGLLLTLSGISGLMMGGSTEGVPENLVQSTQVLWNSGLFHMIKITELVAGIMLILNIYPALAALFIAPLSVGIIVFNAVMMPSMLIAGVIVALLDIYLGYAYWEKYKAIFAQYKWSLIG